jgi:hypothetical protein
LVGDWKVTLNGSQFHEIMVKTMVDELLQCLEGTSVSATKPLLWIRSSSGRSRGQLVYPAQLPKGRKSLPPAFGGFINPHLSDLLHADRDRLHEVDHALRQWRCLSAAAHRRKRMIAHGAQRAPGAWA